MVSKKSEVDESLFGNANKNLTKKQIKEIKEKTLKGKHNDAVIVDEMEIQRIKGNTNVLTKEQAEQQKKMLEEQREQQLAASKARKQKMLELDKKREKKMTSIPVGRMAHWYSDISADIEKRWLTHGKWIVWI
mgnify:CR=1 FL=1